MVAIAGSSQQSAEKKAREYKVDRAYGDYKALIAAPDIQVIHNTTPNHLHLPVTLAALQAGKHVISDKPLALNAEEGRKLRDAAVAPRSRMLSPSITAATRWCSRRAGWWRGAKQVP